MIVNIWMTASDEAYQVEIIENDTTRYWHTFDEYSKALIKVASALLDYKRKGIQPVIHNEVKPNVQTA